MPEGARDFPPLDPAKFQNPLVTAKGDARAWVDFAALDTLWFNTGSLCNIACGHCYMDSGPKKDDLAYLSAAQMAAYLDEIAQLGLATRKIGFTGGEPFMNAVLPAMLGDALTRGFDALVLTNAMTPLWQKREALLGLKARFGAERLTLRVSIDHFTPQEHERERGPGAWAAVEKGVKWLAEHGFRVDVAGRAAFGHGDGGHGDGGGETRRGYQALFDAWGLSLDAFDPRRLVLFPEMDERADVPEITTACWGILGVRPDAQMCATSRMVVWRKGEAAPRVVPCTLLPYDPAFDLGATLAESRGPVRLNHPHCAKFCVLGGASCSAK